MPRLGPNFLTLLSLGLALLLAAMDQTVIAAAMPVIASDLGGLNQYSWIVVSYLLTSALLLPVGGMMSDRWGRKSTMVLGLGGFVLSSVWCGMVGNIPFISAPSASLVSSVSPLLQYHYLPAMNEFIAARLLQGACSGIILSSVFIMIADMYSPAQRGRYQGLFAAIWAAASLIGPFAGGWLTEHHNWRWVFFINVPLGSVALSLLLPARVFEISDVWRHPYNKREIFSRFCNSTIAISIASVFVSGMGMYGATALVPLFFHIMKGTGPQQSGELLTPLVLVTCTFSVIGGMYMSKLRRYKKLVLAGLSLMAAGTFALSAISAVTSSTTILVNLMIGGAGLGLLLPAYTIIIQNVVPEEILGISTGISQFARSAGGAVGTFLMGIVLGRLPFLNACASIFVFYGTLLVLTVLLNLALKEAPLKSWNRRVNGGVKVRLVGAISRCI